MPIYVHIYEELFSKTWSANMALALHLRLFDWHLSQFGKELFIYICKYIIYIYYIYVYVYSDWLTLSLPNFQICCHSQCQNSRRESLDLDTLFIIENVDRKKCSNLFVMYIQVVRNDTYWVHHWQQSPPMAVTHASGTSRMQQWQG